LTNCLSFAIVIMLIKTNMTETAPHTEYIAPGNAYEMMSARLGASGMEMLDGQLAVLMDLNGQPLESPLKDSLAVDNPILPEGTLLHNASTHGLFNVDTLKGIAEGGIVSGELVGAVEDSETSGCADFFRVPSDMTVGDYMDYATEQIRVENGDGFEYRGERMLTRGVTFIVDPHATGMPELMRHDGYQDPGMRSFISPPGRGRTAKNTAAILAGIPRGAIAGLLVHSRLLEKPGVSEQLQEIYPGLTIHDQTGKLHRQVGDDIEGLVVGGGHTEQGAVAAETEPVARPRLELLSDEEFLSASREFGETYKATLKGTEVKDWPLSPEVTQIMNAYHAKTEGMDERQRARLLVTEYRQAMNDYVKELGEEEVYAQVEPFEEALQGVVSVERGPYGLDILRVDGKQNEQLFGDDSLSFAVTGLMLRRGLPPLVVVYDYPKNPVERQQVTTHETSHAVWALLRQSGTIQSSQELSIEGSAFEKARDEAVAQLAAGQNKFTHPNVIKRMTTEGYEESIVNRYREVGQRFNWETVSGDNVQLSDAILSIAMAQNFEEMLSSIERLSGIAEAHASTSTLLRGPGAQELPVAA
jgi:hypothetical protein